MRLLRLFIASVGLASVGLAAAPASAQTIGVPDTFEWSIDRGDRLPTQINRADCRANASIEFTVDAPGGENSLEVWAGSACNEPANRLNNAKCFQVAEPSRTDKSVTIRVQDILQETGSTAAGVNKGTDATCEEESNSEGEIKRFVFFLLINEGDDEPVGTPAIKEFAYDITPPPPPTNVSAGPGEESLQVKFTAPKATDLNGFRFYCSAVGAPPADDGSAGEAAMAADPVDASCSSSVLIPGEDPPEDAVPCGEETGIGISDGTADGLTNGVVSAVAVAAVDKYDNVGKLSALACGTPQEVTGFYEAYRNSGGEAGGGFCSFAPARRGAAAVALALLLGAAALVRRRR